MSVARTNAAVRPALALLTAAALTASPALAQETQPAPLASRDVFFNVDSGPVRNDGVAPAVVFSTIVAADDSEWLRLAFDEVKLAGEREAGNASYLRITSLTDGAHQILDNVSVLQWQLTSAYFNGDAVQIELIAHPGTGDNRLRLSKGVASEPVVSSRSICGPTDDRVLSSDNRSARILPIGCTGWTISDCNTCMLTAGHCMGGISVIQFNVPLSTSGGGLVNPPPQDQYATDPASVQGNNGGSGAGDDWAYYGVFPNSNTGLTPYEAYGVAHNLVLPPSPGGNARVTGYGTTSSPVPGSWNQVQKTHAGPYTAFSGTAIGYRTDTTGGNSGSPVIHEATGNAIGIHTHGGCTSSGGTNWGTGSNHASLQAALANPKGVCACPGPDFAYPNGVPEVLSPSGDTFTVQILPANGVSPVSGTGVLYYNAGSGYVPVAMSDDGTTFVGSFPALPCNTAVTFYVAVQGDNGRTYTAPSGAPGAGAHAAPVAYGVESYAHFNFQTAVGWSVQNTSITGGAWERGTPLGGGARSDPASDFDGSGACYLTGNAAGDSDVDGGPTRLLSPIFNLTGASDPYVSYARWHVTNDSAADRFTVEVSSNAGTTWTVIESVGSQSGWQVKTWRIADYVPLTGAVRFRFSSVDNPNASVTESALDAFRIYDVDCEGCPSDINGDGASDILDFLDFLDAFGNCENLPAPCTVNGVDPNFNGDSVVDILDFLDFLDTFGLGCD